MPDPDFTLAVPLAYVGPGIGLEFIPYLIGLLAWAGLAVGAIILRPVFALLRLFSPRSDGAPATTVLPSDTPGSLAASISDCLTPPKNEDWN